MTPPRDPAAGHPEDRILELTKQLAAAWRDGAEVKKEWLDENEYLFLCLQGAKHWSACPNEAITYRTKNPDPCMRCQLAAAAKRERALVEGLRSFGRHKIDCVWYSSDDHDNPPCTCGLAALLNTAPGEK
jgi:hypothetical protein